MKELNSKFEKTVNNFNTFSDGMNEVMAMTGKILEENAKLKNELITANTATTKRENEINNLRCKIVEEIKRGQIKDKEIAKLNERGENIAAQYNTKTVTITRLENTINTQKRALEILGEDDSKLFQRINNQRDMIQQQRKELTELKKNHDSLMEMHDNQRKTIRKLRKEIKELEKGTPFHGKLNLEEQVKFLKDIIIDRDTLLSSNYKTIDELNDLIRAKDKAILNLSKGKQEETEPKFETKQFDTLGDLLTHLFANPNNKKD